MNIQFVEFLHTEYLGNTVLKYLISAGVFAAGIFLVRIFKTVVLNRIEKLTEKTATDVDDFLISAAEKSAVPLFYYGAFYIALQYLNLTPKAENAGSVLGTLLVAVMGIRLLLEIITFSMRH